MATWRVTVCLETYEDVEVEAETEEEAGEQALDEVGDGVVIHVELKGG